MARLNSGDSQIEGGQSERYPPSVEHLLRRFPSTMHNNKLLGLLVEHIPVGIILTDAESNVLLTSSYMRSMWMKAYDRPVEEYQTMDLRLCRCDGSPFHREDWPLTKAIATRKPVPVELCKMKKTEGDLFVEISASPVIEDGHLLYVFVICDDVTEKIQAQERDSLLRVQSDFLARMSHEIRTPMHGILGMIEVLGGTELSTEQFSNLDIIKRSTKHLLVVLNDILDFTKLDAGRVELDRHAYDIRRLVQDIRAIHIADASVEHRISVSVDASVPERLYGDSHRLSQCLNNLMSNAVKFISPEAPGATVNIEVTTRHSELIISIADEGIGMDPITLSKLFTAFTQANSNITRTYGGTGLGLSITKQLIVLMGGDIKVESTLEKGSVFVINLPIVLPPVCTESVENARSVTRTRKRKNNATTADAKRCRGDNGIRVLLAEDNPTNRKVGINLLRNRGFRVEAVENGQEALDLLETEPDYDILLLDIQMPVMGGHDTCRELRKRRWNRPIIALTASAMECDRLTCLNAGMNDYMSKPFNMDELETKILELVGGDDA